MTEQFTIGQRWVSDTESDLGLGTIIEISDRQVTILFLSAGETRIYSQETAPLTRIAFMAGDTVSDEDNVKLLVERVDNEDGYLTYVGKREDGTAATLEEVDLNNKLRFNSPRDRLFAGQLDSGRWFRLRSRVFEDRFAQEKSVVRGLIGARVSIIPHQIYIAHEVGSRLAPRVLLADEVGLGKTIEAGLIMHRQLCNNLISRVLIVVPETLLHQWLVEMLRKFNLRFNIIDEDRYNALLESAPEGNPFLAQQLVLCSLETLVDNPDIADSAARGNWDCLTVDEAHHLQWSPEAASDAYNTVEVLAKITPAVLLLTATPEQLGAASHFARLKLLDPVRFSDIKAFAAEESDFNTAANLADALLGDEDLSDNDVTSLESILGSEWDDKEKEQLKSASARSISSVGEDALRGLIDRHGTSRVLFRNTRSTITGFPPRKFNLHSLEGEPQIDNWAIWLQEFIQEIRPDRALVICSSKETVTGISETLKALGTASATFHEDMSIVERDRAAAYFADVDEGCKLMLCSEIGSEGRNFQFLHHLVLLELPLAPDLLEQRIGRLDRIGQTEDVQIHVPVCKDSRDECLARWYHEGLNAFETICKVGSTIGTELADELQAALASDPADRESLLSKLISKTGKRAKELNTDLENGRDRLLELNSNRPELVQEHLDLLSRGDRDFRLQDFMTNVFDCFGVDKEEQTNGSWIVKPGDHMQVEQFPGVDEDGLTLTFNRAVAAEREDFTFLSWDHPMVIAAMDMVLDESYGQANAEAISSEQFPKNIALVETLYQFNCVADKKLNIGRYLPASLERFLLGSNRKDYTASLATLELDSRRERVELNKLKQILKSNQEMIGFLLDHSKKLASTAVPEIIEEAEKAVDLEITPEIERLEAMRKVNPSVREDEIDALRERRTALINALQETEQELVAIRVMFNV